MDDSSPSFQTALQGLAMRGQPGVGNWAPWLGARSNLSLRAVGACSLRDGLARGPQTHSHPRSRHSFPSASGIIKDVFPLLPESQVTIGKFEQCSTCGISSVGEFRFHRDGVKTQ